MPISALGCTEFVISIGAKCGNLLRLVDLAARSQGGALDFGNNGQQKHYHPIKRQRDDTDVAEAGWWVTATLLRGILSDSARIQLFNSENGMDRPR